jgi:hypothetical protein
MINFDQFQNIHARYIFPSMLLSLALALIEELPEEILPFYLCMESALKQIRFAGGSAFRIL